MEQTAQYDHIGSKYDEYAQTATLKRAESYTFFRMVGELAGKRVLDLACGFGFCTRLLKQRGAAQVVGVDISRDEVRLACAKEQDDPTGRVPRGRRHPPARAWPLRSGHSGLSAQLCDEQGPDAGHVPERLRQSGGGRAFRGLHGQSSLHPQQAQQHEVWGHRARQDVRGRSVRMRPRVCHRSAHPFQYFQWSQATHEWAMQEAGFRGVPGTRRRWHRRTSHHGAAYWRDFYDNCLVIGLVGQK